jgi:hypothetical protein
MGCDTSVRRAPHKRNLSWPRVGVHHSLGLANFHSPSRQLASQAREVSFLCRQQHLRFRRGTPSPQLYRLTPATLLAPLRRTVLPLPSHLKREETREAGSIKSPKEEICSGRRGGLLKNASPLRATSSAACGTTWSIPPLQCNRSATFNGHRTTPFTGVIQKYYKTLTSCISRNHGKAIQTVHPRKSNHSNNQKSDGGRKREKPKVAFAFSTRFPRLDCLRFFDCLKVNCRNFVGMTRETRELILISIIMCIRLCVYL